MKVKELIQILSNFTKENKEREIVIDSYGNPMDITTVDYNDYDNKYIITFR